MKTILSRNPSGLPTQVATLIIKSGVRGRWRESAVAISVSMGTGDPRGDSPRSVQGRPRISLHDIANGKSIHFNLHWK